MPYFESSTATEMGGGGGGGGVAAPFLLARNYAYPAPFLLASSYAYPIFLLKGYTLRKEAKPCC